MTDYIKCSGCGNLVEKEKSRKVTIYEKVKMRFRGDINYVGHTKLETCFNCLKLIGYALDEEGVK